MVTKGLKESIFAQIDHGSQVTRLEDRDTEEEGERERGEDREGVSWAQPPWSPIPPGSPKGRDTAPGSGRALSSGTLPQLWQEALHITQGKPPKCKCQIYFLRNFCRWLYQTTVPSAVRDTLNQTLPSVPHFKFKILFFSKRKKNPKCTRLPVGQAVSTHLKGGCHGGHWL